jgi:2-dehydropantoate 2-reductase
MQTKLPKIVVVGAGAVGCYFGGMLAANGFPVSFIARDSQLESLNKIGVEIVFTTGIQTYPVKASSDYETLRDASLVLVAVKTQSTLQTAQEIAPFLKSDAIVLSLQNGIDNIALLKNSIAQACYPAMVYAAIAMNGPNQVIHNGGGSLIIGNTLATQDEEHLGPIAEMFSFANIPTTVSQKMLEDMWSKFMVNLAYNGLSAIGMSNYATLAKSPGINEVIDAIVAEAIAVAKAENIYLDPEKITALIKNVPIHWPNQKSSTAQDLMKGKATEIDFLNGSIVAKGKLHNIATPTNALIYSLIKMREYTQGNFQII